MTISFKTIAPLVVVTLLSPIFLQTMPAYAQSAAETDWRRTSEVVKGQRNLVPANCNGLYVQPLKFAEPPEDAHDQSIQVTAQEAVQVIGQSSKFSGDVEIQQGKRQINSSFATLDAESNIATMEGSVSIREPGLLLRGQDATANLTTGTGVINQATFILHESRLRGRAAKIYRQDNNQLLIVDGEFTRCDPGQNTWSIKGSSIRLLTEEGHGVARNVMLKVKGVPVAYFPYFRFPINDDRLSGFLTPGFGSDSNGGTDIVIPYYFNLAPHYDMTYTFRSLWKRGLIHEGEFRYLTTRTDNFINAAFIHKDELFDDRTDFDLTTGASIAAFEKQDRWSVHATHSSALSRNWSASLNFSAVSDTDYLRDIGGDFGSTAIDRATDRIDASLGRNTIPALNRNASINFRSTKWHAALMVQGYQLIDPFASAQYEMLPAFVSSYRDKYKKLQLDMKILYTYFDKDTKDVTGPLATVGQRAVMDATIAIPFKSRWGYFIPSLNVIHRKYDLNDEPLTARSSPEITTPSFSLDSGLTFDRYFHFMGRDFQQSLEPRLYYLYVEHDEQDDLPGFDSTFSTPSYSQIFRKNRFTGYDRIGDTRQLSAGLSTRFLFADTGAEFLVASIGQVYYFKDRKVIFKPQLSTDPTSGSSAVFTQLRMTLGPELMLSSSYEWEPRKDRSNRGNISLKYHPSSQKLFNVTYSYTSPEVKRSFRGGIVNSEESDISFIWPIAGSKWGVIGRWNYGWDENQTIESLFGLEYHECCWGLRIAYRRFLKDPRLITLSVDDPANPGAAINVQFLQQRADSGIFVEFRLSGLGDLGRRLDRLLEESIPGYRPENMR